MRTKTIHRIKRKCHYSQIPNGLLRDRRLSFQARAIAAMMLSMPEDWTTYTDVILDFGKEGRGKDGELSVRKALKELESVGYLVREKVRGEKGSFEGLRWTWCDEPESGFPRSGFPRSGDPHTKNNRSKKDSPPVENSGWKRKKDKGSFVPKRTLFSSPDGFRPRFPYPKTEEDMEHEIQIRGFESNPDYDGGFFRDFHDRGWRMPNGEPVWDWFELYRARVLKTTGEELIETEEGGF
jgi:hypothetical protein